eukprot:GFUD01025791.1.p1 GENE.GFUD01025791.1~~GFUD01025791.1.p1  ORF type:complete len:435 (+),score=89.08 GFUD01025791.1:146-1450(+)
MTTSQRQKVFLVMWITMHSVLGTQMEWANNPDLVDQSNPNQGREHIKFMVVMVGDTIKLECNVLLATQPVNEVQWRVNHEYITNNETQEVETNQDGVFIVSYFVIRNITEEMHNTRVTCEYAKDRYSESVVAILHVVKLKIETTAQVCETCAGDVNLVFKEAKSSPSESNIDIRTILKIAEMTNVLDIALDHLGFSVTLPLTTCMDNQAIWAMNPTVFMNGTESDTLAQCECASAGHNLGMWLSIAVIILIAVVAVVLQFKMTGIKSSLASVISGLIGFVLLILACALPRFNNWYPGTVVVFYLLSPIPITVAKRHGDSSNNTCKYLAWFLTAVIIVSAFALPIALASVPVDHTAIDQETLTTTVIESGACLIVIAANAVLFVTILKLVIVEGSFCILFSKINTQKSAKDCPESFPMKPNDSENEEDLQKNLNR